ncbi:hypothetical protein GGF43_000492 [Coemansia sp. RSA 2618]|nr:hypothetical protein GGF43_000492 [Coemansia sp. RSA 2618]
MKTAPARKLGTWDGVFMLVMLSIWGILVYVHMGYFLSQVGIIGMATSFVCGYLTTAMTTLSISAILTNGTVKGGSPYYMLLQSLGPEFGGSIVAFTELPLSNIGQTLGDVTHTFPEGTIWHILYSSMLFMLCTARLSQSKADTLLMQNMKLVFLVNATPLTVTTSL